MKKQELFDTVLGTLAPKYGDVETELHFTTPFQLLVAVVLSAQCTDKRVNMITPALFEAYPDAAAMAQATPEELLEYIKSVSYPNSKAKHLAGLAQMLVEAFNGEVPTTLEELTRLPGVGRKTANVVLNTAFGHPVMAVDTHIFRVSNRTKIAPGKDVREVEDKLMRFVPKEFLMDAHHWLILHGRYTCKAQKPQCGKCIINDLCEYGAKLM